MLDLNPLLTKALNKIEEKGWVNFQLADIIDNDTSLADIHTQYQSKIDILKDFSHHIDQTTLANVEIFDSNETQKDKLFSIVMTRLDILAPYKSVIHSMWQDSWMDPISLLQTIPLGLNSMSWLLQAAGIDTSGVKGAIRTKVFAVLYLNTIRTWLNDDSEEMDSTMAALDASLIKLEQIQIFF